MAEVEVGLGAVVGHVDFAVLERAHGARIDVDVRIELDEGDFEPASFEDCSQRGGCNALAQRRNNTAGHANKFSHGSHRRRRITTGAQSTGSEGHLAS